MKMRSYNFCHTNTKNPGNNLGIFCLITGRPKLNGYVLLVPEERGVAELLFQHIDFLHSVLVGGVKGLLAGGLADAQPLIVVVVEGVERMGIVDDDLEE